MEVGGEGTVSTWARRKEEVDGNDDWTGNG
jgi:hypothetical protein